MHARSCTSFRSVSFNGTNTGFSWIRGAERIIAIYVAPATRPDLIRSRTRRVDTVAARFRPQSTVLASDTGHFSFALSHHRDSRMSNCNRYLARICVVFLGTLGSRTVPPIRGRSFRSQLCDFTRGETFP